MSAADESAAASPPAGALRRLGDRWIHPVGIGCLAMSTGDDRDEGRSLRTIHAALDAGVQLIDTADSYARDEAEFGHNERLIARALRTSSRGHEAIVATKGGHTRRGADWELDGRPEHLRAACEASLRRLGVERIDLYQFHRPDPRVPFEESIGALRDLRDAGTVRWVGISNVDRDQIRSARRIVEIAAVQNELSPRFPHPLHNGEVAACERDGIAFLPWSPFGGIGNAAGVGSAAVQGVARARGVSPHRVVLAWLLARSPVMIPIPGVSRPETALDCARAPALRLEPGELAALAAGYAPAGP
ncbi:MAG TPA: aldo/keto reductase [Miltoncostaeaceae bacterium]|nr:aldo/keto reductase [Miltoncostaeaceae bacterium]